ncbi:MAG: hypothetical protein ACRC1H_13195 [Caldilineaceae bacterium]
MVTLVLAMSVAACAPAPIRPQAAAPTPVPLDQAWTADPAALVTAERNAAAARDGATLAALWAEDAVILELRGAGDADDYRWVGRTAILDRYTVAVFPAPPPPLDAPLALTPQVEGDTATLVNGVDRWSFALRDGRWWITALEIGAP